MSCKYRDVLDTILPVQWTKTASGYAATHGFPWNVDAPNITVHEYNSRWILDVVTFDRLAPHIGYILLTHAIVVATLAGRRATLQKLK